VAKAAINAMLMGVNQTATSIERANAALDQFLGALSASGVSLTIIDGYIAGATALIDANGNGKLDPGEFSGKTDASGKISLPATAPAGKVIATGGTDLLTGKEFTGGGCTEFCVNGLMAGNRRISRSGYDLKHKESSTQRSHRQFAG
jgi:hypothetical protein